MTPATVTHFNGAFGPLDKALGKTLMDAYGTEMALHNKLG